ncbi:MAG: RNA polymerase subunit sigma-70 [bacterium]|nr:RNA polymerase subunit sigma-70 [bacterium]
MTRSATSPATSTGDSTTGDSGTDDSTPDVTSLLEAWSHGDDAALAELMEVVQEELLRIAGQIFRGERRDHTLQPTALVAEVYLKLEGQRRVDFRHRTDFFAVAAKLMRRILVDHARRHSAGKRGGQTVQVALDQASGLPTGLVPEIIALDDALIDLERRSPRQSRIVEMRVLVGLNLEDIAAVEKISLSTVSRDWNAARLFLLSQLSPS